MRGISTFTVASLALFSFLAVSAAPVRVASAAEDHSADEAAIKKCVDDFTAAWNRHDAHAMAAAWTEDGTLVNPFGATASGRAAVEKLFEREQAGPFKQSRYEVLETKTQWVSDDVVLVDLNANISGITPPTPPAPAEPSAAAPAPTAAAAAMTELPHHVTWLLVKKDGHWQSAAARAFQYLPKPGESKTADTK